MAPGRASSKRGKTDIWIFLKSRKKSSAAGGLGGDSGPKYRAESEYAGIPFVRFAPSISDPVQQYTLPTLYCRPELRGE